MRACVAAVPATLRRENNTRYFSGRDVAASTTLRSRDATTSSGASTRVAMVSYRLARSVSRVTSAAVAAGGGWWWLLLVPGCRDEWVLMLMMMLERQFKSA
jgi:hypothetical protein